jgi:hypothetical protein
MGGIMSQFFTRNEHTIDRVVRVGLGLGLLAIAWVGPKTALGYLGLIPLATGLIGVCPAYSLLGVSTCRTPKR